jgi:hypothetical protein
VAGTGYSPLAQINTSNVATLAQAWTYRLQSESTPPPAAGRGGAGAGANSQATPIVVNGVMYLPAANRIVRSIESDFVAWASPGEWLGQTFAAPGPFTAVSLDLTAPQGIQVCGRIELCALDGSAMAHVPLRGDTSIPWDHFSAFIEVGSAVPAGQYLIKIVMDAGRIGWRTLLRVPPV